MREKYESLSVTVLKELAKARGLKHLSGLKKTELVDLMVAEDEKDAAKQAKDAGALISTEGVRTQGSSTINEIPLDQIEANPNQPRREFDDEARCV